MPSRAPTPTTADYRQISHELVDLAQTPEGEWLLPFRSTIGAAQYWRLYRQVEATVVSGGRVLDWGVASGHFSYYLQRKGYRAVGYSIEDLTFSPLVNDSTYQFVRGGANQPRALPFATGSFDSVVSVGVLEHVRETGGDEAASLAEIHRVLKSGGSFICYHLPSKSSWIEFLARRSPHRHAHLHLYSRRQTLEMMHAAGFGSVEARQYAFLPRNVWRILPPWARHSGALGAVFEAADTVLESVLPALCTYHRVVGRK
jgi:SAM-dependent methyltransferase